MSTSQMKIIIAGSGGHAKVIIDILEKLDRYDIIGFIDGFKAKGTSVYGYEVLGDESYIQDNHNTIDGGIVAIGDNWVRSKVVSRILAIHTQFKFITAVHPSATIARGVTVGDGTVIMAGSVINSDTVIGEHCILNTKSSVDHDCTVRDFVTIAPNATTGGNVKIGNFSTVSLGANIIHSREIGAHTIIGAGSNVLSDIGSFTVAYGTPARVIRSREQGENYL